MGYERFKEELKRQIDIVDLINSYVPLVERSGRFWACCPFHQEDTPSFSVKRDSQFYYCFGCHKSGDVITFVMERENVTFVEALRLLAGHAGVPFPEQPPPGGGAPNPERGQEKDRLYQLHQDLARWYQQNLYAPIGKVALEYVRGRQLSDELVRKFGLGYAPDGFEETAAWGTRCGYSRELMIAGGVLTRKNPEDPPTRAYDRWRHRLMFPIWNEQGRIVAFSGRKLREEDGGGKYVNSPETPLFTKGRILYALPLARKAIKDHGFALLCEGQVDTIACHAAGLDNAVAPQGTAFTEQQARLLRHYTRRIVLCFDGDEAGRKAAIGSLDSFISADLSAKIALLDPEEDPDSTWRKQGAEALRQRVAAARDYFEMLLELGLSRADAHDPATRRELAETFLGAVARVPSAYARAEYCQFAASRLGVPVTALLADLRRLINERARAQAWGRRGGDPPPAAGTAGTAAAVATAPPGPPPASQAEVTLCEIAFHHRDWAVRLVTDLPPGWISETAVGGVFSELLACTREGDWEEARGAIQARLPELASPVVSRLVCNPEFGPERTPRQVAQACQECLSRLAQEQYEKARRDLEAQRAAAPPEQRAEWLRLREALVAQYFAFRRDFDAAAADERQRRTLLQGLAAACCPPTTPPAEPRPD